MPRALAACYVVATAHGKTGQQTGDAALLVFGIGGVTDFLDGFVARWMNQQTALGAVIFFWARLAHAVLYIAGIWKLRWIAFFTAWGGELLIIFRLLLH